MGTVGDVVVGNGLVVPQFQSIVYEPHVVIGVLDFLNLCPQARHAQIRFNVQREKPRLSVLPQRPEEVNLDSHILGVGSRRSFSKS